MAHEIPQSEIVTAPETEHAAYLSHWQDFATEQLALPNSPIRKDEEIRFRTRCAGNATYLRNAHEIMFRERTPETVYNWYARLGSTSELEGAKPDLVKALSIVVNNSEVGRSDHMTLLAGNLSQEIALQSEGKEAEGFFALAARNYDSLVRRHNPRPDERLNKNTREVRQAIAHSFDTAFARLSYGLRDGLIEQADFDKKYHDKHEQFVRFVHSLTDKDSNIGNGELYEFYGEMVLRHQLWSMEKFGRAEVRRAFTPREDRPHDDFVHGGRHVNQRGALPSYAFDLKLTVPDGSEPALLLQLKEDSDGLRYANPPITVLKYGHGIPLRRHARELSEIMLKSYRFDTSPEEEEKIMTANQEFGVAVRG